MEQEPKQAIDPKESIKMLLRRRPSGPDFEQSTIAHSQECLESASLVFRTILTRQYPHLIPVIEEKLNPSIDVQAHRPSFHKEGDKVFLVSPYGTKIPAITALHIVAKANPDLIVFKYAILLYPPSRNRKHTDQRFPGYNSRLHRIIIESQLLSPKSPEAKIIALAYITQVAKIVTVQKCQELLRKTQLFGGIAGADKVEPFLANVAAPVSEIRQDQLFIAKGLSTIDQIAKKANLEKDQVQLLLDLAFVRNRAFDSSSEFQQVFVPLIKMVAGGKWEEAFRHRDFLLHFFAASFPNWRVRRFEREQQEHSFESFRDLSAGILKGLLSIDPETIPEQYQAFLTKTMPKKLVMAEHEEEKSIITRTLKLSNRILRRMQKNPNFSFLNLVFHADKIETQGNQQIVWYATETERAFRDNEGNIVSLNLNYAPLGRLFFWAVVGKNPGAKSPRPLEMQQEVVEELESIYNEERAHFPDLAQITFADYLKTLLVKARIESRIFGPDPVNHIMSLVKTPQ